MKISGMFYCLLVKAIFCYVLEACMVPVTMLEALEVVYVGFSGFFSRMQPHIGKDGRWKYLY